MLTSNDIRELPAALVRRCVVLELKLPKALEDHLVWIGEAHQPEMDHRVLREAARQIIRDRDECREPPKTGLAEYLDLLHALNGAGKGVDEQLAWLKTLAPYFHKSAAVPR